MVYNLLARLFPLLNDGFLDYLQKKIFKKGGYIHTRLAESFR